MGHDCDVARATGWTLLPLGQGRERDHRDGLEPPVHKPVAGPDAVCAVHPMLET